MPSIEAKNSHLKPSNYNYFIKYDEDTYYGYNFLYRSLIRIPIEIYPAVNQLMIELKENKYQDDQISDQIRQWIAALQESNFVIDNSNNELNFVKFFYYRNLFANDFLSLILLPTLWCNFDCPYCFEYKKPVFMSKKVEDELVNWVKNNFSNKRSIHISWFGGEPLLAKDQIRNLTNEIKLFSNGIGAKYWASITTNGFLLDEEFQSELNSLGIKHVQVTLDGDENDHNHLRYLRDGKPSFETIFSNLVSFCSNVNDCNLTIRINCGDENYEGITNLLRRFPQRVKEKATVFFRWIWPNEASNYKEFSKNLRSLQPFEKLGALYLFANALGWRTSNPTLQTTFNYCEIDYLDQYSIDPYGNIFLCSHTYKKSESIGSLVNSKNQSRIDDVDFYIKWYTSSPFENHFCISCKLLPVCWGGCRKSRVVGEVPCIEEKNSEDLFVRTIIRNRLLTLTH